MVTSIPRLAGVLGEKEFFVMPFIIPLSQTCWTALANQSVDLTSVKRSATATTVGPGVAVGSGVSAGVGVWKGLAGLGLSSSSQEEDPPPEELPPDGVGVGVGIYTSTSGSGPLFALE